MNARVMVDTNVFVYGEDGGAQPKQALARAVLGRVTGLRVAVTSSQVLGEYFVTLLRRFGEVFDIGEAQSRVAELRAAIDVIDTDADIVVQATEGVRRYGMHFYDAEIWAAAKAAGARVVLSEDFASGSEIEGVRFVNPFAEDFDLDRFAETLLAD